MPKFVYTALDRTGAEVSGKARAKTISQVRFELEEQDLTVTSIEAKKGLTELDITPARIKPGELMHISRQLAAFLRAGIPILDALAELREGTENRGTKRVLGEIGDDLAAGFTLSEAFEKHSNDFPPYYLGILRSAELTGNLDTVLDRLAIDIERDNESRRKLRSAMTYPAIVAVISVGTVVVLTMFVLPKFQEFFQSLDAELPAPTRLLLVISAFIQQWAWLIGLIALVLVVGYIIAIRTHAGRRVRDRMVLRLPVVGSTIQVAMAERFTRVLASLVSAGVPLPQAMGVSVDSLKNLAFEEPLQEARTAMMEGAGLAGPIAVTRLFPPMAVQMIRVGEETGSLDSQLEVAAEFYERELDYKVKKLAALVEPAVIVFMGGLVGFVAVALVSAMYGIFRATNLT